MNNQKGILAMQTFALLTTCFLSLKCFIVLVHL